MGLPVAGFEVTGLLGAESADASDCSGRSALCEPTMLGTAGSTEVGSGVGNCLRIRVGGFDEAWGVLDDTLDATLAVFVAKPWLVVVVEECVVKDAKDAVGDVALEAGSALGSRPPAAPTELCSCCTSCWTSCCVASADRSRFPRRLVMVPINEPSKPVQWFGKRMGERIRITDR